MRVHVPKSHFYLSGISPACRLSSQLISAGKKCATEVGMRLSTQVWSRPSFMLPKKQYLSRNEAELGYDRDRYAQTREIG